MLVLGRVLESIESKLEVKIIIHHQTHGWNVVIFTRTFELVFVVGLLADYADYVVNGSHSAMRIFSNLMLKQQLQTSMI